MNRYRKNFRFQTYKKYLLLLILLSFWNSSQSQTLEVGAIVGGSNYQGDITSSEFAVLKQQINFGIGGFLRYNFNEQLSLKLQILSTELEGEDALSSNEILRQRNLRFSSPLLDASLRVEWHFLETIFGSESIISPYVSVGGSFFTFNPQAVYEGTLHDLQELSTEGQGLEAYPDRERYELYNFSVLGGIGIAFKVSDDFQIAIDFTGHRTFTDYLDDVSTTYVDYFDLLDAKGLTAANIAYQSDDFFDVSQTSPPPGSVRGNPNFNDYYFIGGITLSYNLINPYRTSGRRGQIGCPTF